MKTAMERVKIHGLATARARMPLIDGRARGALGRSTSPVAKVRGRRRVSIGLQHERSIGSNEKNEACRIPIAEVPVDRAELDAARTVRGRPRLSGRFEYYNS
jgi:hypothetical protein